MSGTSGEAPSFAGEQAAAEDSVLDLSPAEAAELFDLLRMFSRLDPTDRIAVLELAQTLAETPESS